MTDSNGLRSMDIPSAQYAFRESLLYFRVVENLLREVPAASSTICDVGCGDSTFIDRIYWVAERYAIDKEVMPCAKTATNVQGDFRDIGLIFDVTLCLQVIEHLDDPKAFLGKLIAQTKKALIVSVPFMWEKGASPDHVQDPISIKKFLSWLPDGVQPDTLIVCKEETNPLQRLIARFTWGLEPQHYPIPRLQ